MNETQTQPMGVKTSLMDSLIKSIPLVVPKLDDLIEGVIVNQKGSSLFIDIGPFGTGIIYGKK